MLEAPRIRCMCGDVSKYLREYGDEYRELSKKSDDRSNLLLNQRGEHAMSQIDAVIHHHCGDNEHCLSSDCSYRRLDTHHYCKHKVEVDDQKMRTETLALCQDEIDEDYANKSCFSGMSMSMGMKGHAKLMYAITKRLDMINIDRDALTMSSNRCKNYFSVLVTFTCGKRIYFGRKDG